MSLLAVRAKNVSPKSLPTTSVGVWVEDCPSGVSVSGDRAVMNANNVTLTNTYQINHNPLGSSTNPGGHTTVQLVPTATAIEQDPTCWQVAPNVSTSTTAPNVPIAIPPSGVGTSNQLLVNYSALALDNGSTWSYAPTTGVTGLTCLVTVLCPAGGNLITVIVTLTYTQTVTSASTLVIPLQNVASTQVVYGTPLFGFGGLGYTYNVGAVASPTSWTLSTAAYTPSAATNTAYTNAITVTPVATNPLPSTPAIFSAQFVYQGL